MKSNQINKRILLTNAGTTIAQNIIEYNLDNILEIFATDTNEICYAAKALKDNFFIVPPFRQWTKFKEALLEICREKKVDLIIPCGNDNELIKFAKDVKYFKNVNIDVLTPDYESIKICNDKVKCNKFVSDLGIKVPKDYKLSDSLKNIKFPLILKNKKGGGSQNIQIINNEKDLLYYKSKFKNVILQEFVKGQEYSIDAVLNNSSEIIVASCRKRLVTKAGICTKTEILPNEKIINFVGKIAKELKLISGINMQFIDDYFIEINPRLPGGLGLVTKAGFNMSLLAIKSFYNLPILAKEKEFKKTKVFRIWKDILYDK